VHGASLDKGVELDALAKLPEPERLVVEIPTLGHTAQHTPARFFFRLLLRPLPEIVLHPPLYRTEMKNPTID